MIDELSPLIPKRKLTKESSEREKKAKLQSLPSDFAQRVASKVESIVELERDEDALSDQIAKIFYNNLNETYLVDHFFNIINILIKDEDKKVFAAMIYTSLHNHEDIRQCSQFIRLIVRHMVVDNKEGDREPFVEDRKKRRFSAYAADLSECFIQIMSMKSDLYDVITQFYTAVITFEMELDLKEEKKSSDLFTQVKKKTDKLTTDPTQKKLYDDIIDYVAYRSEFSSNSLNQKNPNEFISVLAERMRSTRKYVIQELMNKHVMRKKMQLEKELKDKEASPEDIIKMISPFAKGLFLFWVEKNYNYHYLAVDKVRVTLQISTIMMGLSVFLLSFLQLNNISIIEALFVNVLMYGFSRIIFSIKYFKSYFPKDVTNALEQEVSTFTPIFRKLSKEQLENFLMRQVRLPKNKQIIQFVPEFIRYVYSIVTDHTNFLLTHGDLSDVIESIEIEIARQKRNSLKSSY